MIARISASTIVSPQGFYMFEEDEDEDDEGGRRSWIIIGSFELRKTQCVSTRKIS